MPAEAVGTEAPNLQESETVAKASPHQSKEVFVKTDSQIQRDVMQELEWDPSVSHAHIGVSVSNGVVSLSGTVPSYSEKSAAERAAQRVADVKAVVEKIDVKLPSSSERDDQDIAHAVLQQFGWNIQVPEKDIKVTVEDGWVTLKGEVTWDFQRTAAESSIRHLTGVKGILNNLTLKVKRIDLGKVKQKIEDALKREAVKEAGRISVDVQGDKVVLRGKVRTFAEMEDAKWAAWSAPGVMSVDNQINVSP